MNTRISQIAVATMPSSVVAREGAQGGLAGKPGGHHVDFPTPTFPMTMRASVAAIES